MRRQKTHLTCSWTHSPLVWELKISKKCLGDWPKRGFIHLWGRPCLPLLSFFTVTLFLSRGVSCAYLLSDTHRFTDIFTLLSPSFPLSLSLSFPPPSPSLSLPHLILMHGCIFGLCGDSLAPGGFSWNQFTLPVPSHWSTIYRPSTAGAAGRLFNRYIRCLTWQSVYGRYRPCFKHKECHA